MDAAVPNLSPSDADGRLEGGAVLLDVREPDEWQAGHAPRALHIPLGELGDRLEEIPSGAEVIAVCRSGGRSLAAATALRAAGIDAANLVGGMQSWDAAGLAVVTDDGEAGQVI